MQVALPALQASGQVVLLLQSPVAARAGIEVDISPVPTPIPKLSIWGSKDTVLVTGES